MTSETCREMRATLGAAALGHLEPAEEIALRAHLDGCPDCRAELRSLRSVARALPLADPAHLHVDPPQPPSELGDLVRDRIAGLRTAHRRRVTRRAGFGVGAAVLAAAVISLVLLLPRSEAPSTSVVFPSSHGAGGHATLVAQKAGTRVALHASGLHDGDYYWLWVTGDDGDRLAAGTFQGSHGSVDVTMHAALPLDEARRIWVTDAHNAVVLDTLLPRA
jgi:hypothetical protein